MTDEKKPLTVEFAPGCFDSFEGTQEELDEFMAELQAMFANMTPEELEAQSQPVDLDELESELSEEEVNHLLNQLSNDPRTLQ